MNSEIKLKPYYDPDKYRGEAIPIMCLNVVKEIFSNKFLLSYSFLSHFFLEA